MTLLIAIIGVAIALTLRDDWTERERKLKRQMAALTSSSDNVLVLDELDRIPALNPRHARQLNAAGVLTYQDLAELSAAKLTRIVGDEPDVDAWQTEAAQLAAASGRVPAWYEGQS